MPMSRARTRLSTQDLVYISLFAVLIAICAWISIPSTVPFTMQTFAVLCAMGLLGGKRSVLAVVLYLLLGAVGLPVFSGFRGGLGMLLGVTGGYLVGFLCSTLLYWLWTSFFGDKPLARFSGMLLGLVACYAFGTWWFMIAYASATGPIGLATALGWCVVPFLIPEAVKVALAFFVVGTVPRRVKAFR